MAVGAGARHLRSSRESAEPDARVVADHGRARSVGVESTPTFFVNGRKLAVSDSTPAGLRSAIRRALGQ